MRLQTSHVVAGLIAAVAFCLAFIAAGLLVLSAVFMGLGLIAVAWLAWSLIRQVRSDSGNQTT
jgi:threonine/homoserine/homoserine lactone efflux protein